MPINQVLTSHRAESSVGLQSVVRNTYMLLSLTLLFSAFTAYWAMSSNATPTSSLVTFIVGFVLLFATMAFRNSAWGIVAIFAFTGCTGYSLGPMLNFFIKGYSNGTQLILTALLGTGLTFIVSSFYIFTTRKDMSAWGKFIMIALIMCIIAGIANIFFQIPAMQVAISSILVFVSTLLIMFDTSRIIHGGETNYIMATISLYLDIIMLFQNLLTLLGMLQGRD